MMFQAQPQQQHRRIVLCYALIASASAFLPKPAIGFLPTRTTPSPTGRNREQVSSSLSQLFGTADEDDATTASATAGKTALQYDFGHWAAMHDDEEEEEEEEWEEDVEKGLNGDNGSVVDTALREEVDKLNQRLGSMEKVLRSLLKQQQRQVAAADPTSNGDDQRTTFTGSAIVPLKAMLFIDGTWLYYSLYGRESGHCPIRKNYGMGWHQRYYFDWSILPKVICQALQGRGWSSYSTDEHERPIEIVRASVFTSYKADTLSTSLRYQLFEDLKAANYDVHQMETVGKSEKCVDIQLSVEMLHYATIPDAFDVAILLSGDKDFLPALVRTRQKGRKVALVSMRRGCNNVLRTANGVKDFDVVWLEDHLEALLKPKDLSVQLENDTVSVYTISKALMDFIDASGWERVSSRDVGRYIQCLQVGKTDLLSSVRNAYGGLGVFVAVSTLFTAEDMDPKTMGGESSGFGYWVTKLPNADKLLMEIEACTTLSKDEQEFLDAYSTDPLKDAQTAYYHTLMYHGEHQGLKNGGTGAAAMEDFSGFTVAQLKERCRERGLPTTGLKATLLERVMEDAEQQLQQELTHPPRPSFWSAQPTEATTIEVAPEVAEYLQGIVTEFLKASGGRASSREVGRYLAAYKSSTGEAPPELSALKELKNAYGGVSNFVNANANLFQRSAGTRQDDFSFDISLAQ